jgi:hypothetical protein
MHQSLAQLARKKVAGVLAVVSHDLLLSGWTVPNVKKLLVRSGSHILSEFAGCPI